VGQRVTWIELQSPIKRNGGIVDVSLREGDAGFYRMSFRNQFVQFERAIYRLVRLA
jgi:hypothetical protein